MAVRKTKKIRGLINQGQRRQLEQLGIDPGPSPSERAKRPTPAPKQKKKGRGWRDFVRFLD